MIYIITVMQTASEKKLGSCDLMETECEYTGEFVMPAGKNGEHCRVTYLRG